MRHRALCLHPDCTWTHDGPGFDAAAEKHAKTSGHGTTTCLAGGPVAAGREK